MCCARGGRRDASRGEGEVTRGRRDETRWTCALQSRSPGVQFTARRTSSNKGGSAQHPKSQQETDIPGTFTRTLLARGEEVLNPAVTAFSFHHDLRSASFPAVPAQCNTVSSKDARTRARARLAYVRVLVLKMFCVCLFVCFVSLV